ncbi:MAG TPA: sensor histidine kinase [Bryobacteraceae bacterium]|nr:sensor histidine kinase [Bryobacteraceae bacterium]
MRSSFTGNDLVQVLENISWGPLLSWGRVALGAAALASNYLLVPDASAVSYGLMGLYLVYALVVALRAHPHRGLLGLLALFGDTVYLLVVATYGGGNMLWLVAIFFLYLMAEAVVFHGLVETAVIVAVTALYCALLPIPELHGFDRTIIVAGALACAFAGNKRRQSIIIDQLRAEIIGATESAEKAREVERQRIASDFHDGPLQSFISIQMRLEILRKMLERDFNAGMDDLHQLQNLAITQVRDLRVFLHSMRPVDMDGGNLISTARRTAESFQKESGIPVTFVAPSTPVGLPQEASAEVLQMIREALHNVQKHSGATRVAVTMEKTDRGVDVSIEDNGHGFNFAGTYSLEELELMRLGPASLKRRARSLNAEFQLESRPGRGTGLKFRIPLQ